MGVAAAEDVTDRDIAAHIRVKENPNGRTTRTLRRAIVGFYVDGNAVVHGFLCP